MDSHEPKKHTIPPEVEWLFSRTRELQEQGVDHDQAFGLADLEQRIAQWPAAWGDDMHVLVYGDFQPPAADLEFPALGIKVLATKRENTAIAGAMTVLDAHVTVPGKSVAAILDAIQRLNIFIGAWSLTDWAHGYRGWWCYMTHATGGGVIGKISQPDIEGAAASVLRLRPAVRRKVEAALFWIRATPRLFRVSHQDAILRLYPDYWNAFECLVDAVAVVVPPQTLNRSEKQARIDAYLAQCSHRLTAEQVSDLYKTVVNSGFVGKATHALRVCFEGEADRYIRECFTTTPPRDRLYNIRNSINHGTVDPEDPRELVRLNARFHRLWMIVWMMFARLVSFPAPLDLPEKKADV